MASCLLFLDVDGVLVPHGHSDQAPFNEACALLLKHIVDQTGAGIVLSSDWRNSEQGLASIASLLEKLNLPHILSSTPLVQFDWSLPPARNTVAHLRGREILKWLNDNREVHPTKCWVAIDDLDLSPFPQFKGHFVQTDFSVGLTPELAELAISLLKGST